MVYILSVSFSSKCSLFQHSKLFGSGFIHILYTVCAKIKKKKFRRQTVNCITFLDLLNKEGEDRIRGWFQNFPDLCRHLHSNCVSAKHR